VTALVAETARTRNIVLELPAWPGHRAGQHVDVRLTAPDGYQAQRSYSIASAPGDDGLTLTVERLDDGEVSPYLVDELRVGDELELRGPIGGYFVWDDSFSGPVLLIAGGSGIVPFRAMLRHRVAAGEGADVRLLYSSHSLEETIYRSELLGLAAEPGISLELVLTRRWPEEWAGPRGRIDRGVIEQAAWPLETGALNFVCGPSSFVELAAGALVDLGHPPARVKTERFGPTG
jgi:ferredoxin-NADP reductase